MTIRLNVSSGNNLERKVGYSRAVRQSNMIFVSGTSGIDVAEPGDSYSQAKRSLEKIEQALSQAGSSFKNVVRTRVFLSRSANSVDVAKAHEETFRGILPASTMIVCEFLDPKILVEIEADAFADEE